MSMQNVLTAPSGNGRMMAAGGMFWPLVNGKVVTAKTASYTVLASEANQAFSNKAAAGAITFTLPAVADVLGRVFSFVKVTAQNVVLDGAGSETIDGATTLTNSTAGDAGKAVITLVATEDGWLTLCKTGSWA